MVILPILASPTVPTLMQGKQWDMAFGGNLSFFCSVTITQHSHNVAEVVHGSL